MNEELSLFRNNGLLRGHKTKYNFTQEDILEFAKCKNDIIYFTETYMQIINLDVGKTLFKLHDFQKEMLLAFKDEKRVITVASRQVGKSIVTVAYMLWFSVFHKDKTIAILSNKASGSMEVIGRYQLAYESLPFFLQPGVKFLVRQHLQVQFVVNLLTYYIVMNLHL
jgi:hypothetical protein